MNTTIRSEAYRRLVAQLPCIRCGIEGYSQHAHSNQAKYGKGKGLKADDRYAMPLCADRPGIVGCHTKHDQFVDYDRQQAKDLEDIWIGRTMARVIEHYLGVNKI